MSNNKYRDLFKNIQKNYENRHNKIKSSINSKDTYNYVFETDSDDVPIVNVIDNNGKSILQAKYSVVGVYNPVTSIWNWGWACDFVNRKLIKHKSKIHKFASEIKENYDNFEKKDRKDIEELYFHTSNRNFYMNSKKIDLLMKFVLHITDTVWFLSISHKNKSITDENDEHPVMYIEYILLNEVTKYD